MKIWIGAIFITLIGSVGLWWSLNPSKSREPATIVDNENIQTLLEIPLVKNLERPERTESRDASQLIDLFSGFAQKNRSQEGALHRGTHAKGKCFRGELEVLALRQLIERGAPEDLALRLKRGIWNHDGRWPVVMRFANANGMGKVLSDKEPDVRGLSFSVTGPGSLNTFSRTARQDFMMNSTPQFATGGIREFVEVVKAANNLIYRDFSYIADPLYYPAIGRALKLISQGNKDGSYLKSYAHVNYWSNLPYTHGLDREGNALDVVKYKATPCDGKGVQRLSSMDNLSDNYLQDEIVKRAQNSEICFLIQVQFMDMEALKKKASFFQRRWSAVDWVEQGGLLWDEEDMPFYTIGRLLIAPQSGSGVTSEISCDNQYINTRLHSNPDNQPVGSIARVRTLVEENSRLQRMEQAR